GERGGRAGKDGGLAGDFRRTNVSQSCEVGELPPPDEIAAEIVESLERALERFRSGAERVGYDNVKKQSRQQRFPVNGAWVSVPTGKILKQSAPDLGFHVCAPFKFDGQPDHLYCVVVPPEI